MSSNHSQYSCAIVFYELSELGGGGVAEDGCEWVWVVEGGGGGVGEKGRGNLEGPQIV